jgi:hypothetical protein
MPFRCPRSHQCQQMMSPHCRNERFGSFKPKAGSNRKSYTDPKPPGHDEIGFPASPERSNKSEGIPDTPLRPLVRSFFLDMILPQLDPTPLTMNSSTPPLNGLDGSLHSRPLCCYWIPNLLCCAGKGVLFRIHSVVWRHQCGDRAHGQGVALALLLGFMMLCDVISAVTELMVWVLHSYCCWDS